MIEEFMKQQHRDCDTHFAKTEELVDSKDWDNANISFLAFKNETLEHFNNEESILFPKFEEITGNSEGPTKIMKMEHIQIRDLIDKLELALSNKEVIDYLSISEATMILLQQHNMKEEQMLYPMCDNAIPENITSSLIELMTNK